MSNHAPSGVSSQCGKWVEERCAAFIQGYTRDHDQLTQQMQSLGPKETLKTMQRVTKLAKFRVPLEEDLHNHIACRRAAEEGRFSFSITKGGGQLQGKLAGCCLVWVTSRNSQVSPKLAREERQSSKTDENETTNSGARPVVPSRVHRLEELNTAEKYNAHVRLPSNRTSWVALNMSLAENQTRYLNARRAAGKKQPPVLPLDCLRKIGDYLNPIDDVLLNPAYLTKIAVTKRAEHLAPVLRGTFAKCVQVATLAGASQMHGSVDVAFHEHDKKRVSKNSFLSFSLLSVCTAEQLRCKYVAKDEHQREIGPLVDMFQVRVTVGAEVFEAAFPTWESRGMAKLYQSAQWKRLLQQEEKAAVGNGAVYARATGLEVHRQAVLDILREFYEDHNGMQFRQEVPNKILSFQISWDS
ncbi:unnamed protein product [Amoebophrya sp. A120]|nr:unnamed protein product [Amoebophrya sp. A120]|eukprot:GSA120T00004280001.1